MKLKNVPRTSIVSPWPATASGFGLQARKQAQGCSAVVLLPTGPLLALAHVGTAGSLRRPRTAVAAGPRVTSTDIDHCPLVG